MKKIYEKFDFTKRDIIIWLALLALGFVLGIWRGGMSVDHQHDGVNGEAVTVRETIYYCSMHPQVRSPDPNDKCPICFMDLIPLPDDDDEGDDESDVPQLRLSKRAAALMEIRTLPVERRAVELEVELFGKVDFDESRLYNIPVRTDAYVERLLVNTPWQPVAKGDMLAELYSPAAVTAMRELLVAEAATVEAARARLRRMGVTDEQIAEIEKDKVVPRTFRMVSPAAGAVTALTVREGEYLREGAHLMRVADLSRVWVNLEAYERDLPWLGVGQTSHFSVASLPGESFEGVVTFAEPVINPRSRTARLRVEADNSDGWLKPGMLVSAQVRAPYVQDLRLATPDSRHGTPDAPTHPHSHTHTLTNDAPLVIPVSAPLITGRRALVYVRVPAEDRPTFEPRRITLGPRAGDLYIVKDGITEGDLVVVNGQFKIDSELQLRGRPSMMAPEDADDVDRDPEMAEGLQTLCPVMGAPINKDFFVDVEGYRLYVCCPGCDQQIEENPSKYIDEMKAAGVTPYKLQTHCPVMGGEIDRNFYHDHDGQRIYVCCPGCLDEVKERADEIIEEQRAKGVVFERVEDET